MDRFWTHFDKFLLSLLFLISLATFMHFAREMAFYSNTQNAAHLSNTVNWLENTIGQILAALLTLLVGKGLTQTQTAPPSNGKMPSAPAMTQIAVDAETGKTETQTLPQTGASK